MIYMKNVGIAIFFLYNADRNQLLLCDNSALKELEKAMRLVSDDQLKEQARLILQRLEQ